MPPSEMDKSILEMMDPVAILNRQKEKNYVCTVVSLLPFTIIEDKPHIFPGVFEIPGTGGKKAFTVTYVGESVHFIPDPFDEKRNHRQLTPPYEMARSICEDYNSAHVATSDNAGPGLFWVHGRLSVADVDENHRAELKLYQARQTQWFKNLCDLADADWERNHNRMAVSDLQRVAAKALNLNKDWVEFHVQEMIKCPYCTVSINPESVKCAHCNEVVNAKKYAELKAKMEGAVTNVGPTK